MPSDDVFIEAANSIAFEHRKVGPCSAEVHQLCRFCEDESNARRADFICLSCGPHETICSSCLATVHDVRRPVYKHHKVCSISDVVRQPVTEKSTCCKHPSKDMDLVCETCSSSIICSACVIENHDGHKVRSLDAVAEEQKVVIRSLCSDLQVQQSKICAIRTDALKKAEEYQKSSENVRAQITDGLERIAKCSESTAAAQLQLLEKLEESTLKEYDGHLDALEMKQMTCRRCIGLTERMLEQKGDSAELYLSNLEVLEKLGRVLSQSSVFYPPKKTVALTETSKQVYDEFVKKSLFELSFFTRGVPSVCLDRGTAIIGSQGSANGQFNTPTGILLYPKTETYPDGLLFVADSKNYKIQVFNATTSKFVRSISPPNSTAVASYSGYLSSYYSTNELSGLALLRPATSDFFPDGLLFFSDLKRGLVQTYDLSCWEPQSTISNNLSQPGRLELLQPNDAYPDGLLFVGDFGSHSVNVFKALTGDFLYQIGTGTSGSAIGAMNYPLGIALRLPSETVKQYQLYVADYNNNRVQVFDAITRAYIKSFGIPKKGTAAPMTLKKCCDIKIQEPSDIYPEGVVYVADSNAKCVQVFNLSTEMHIKTLAGSIGKSPAEIAICSDIQGNNLVFVTNQTNHVVDVYLD